MSAKIIYWALLLWTIVTLSLGICGAFFSNSFLHERAKFIEPRVGKRGAQIFIWTIRILCLTVAVLSLYLLDGFLGIFSCAMK